VPDVNGAIDRWQAADGFSAAMLDLSAALKDV
jgi:hypothetical protein